MIIHLTKRESSVCHMISAGMRTKEIAIKLGLSPRTVEAHRIKAMRKHNARNGAHLVALVLTQKFMLQEPITAGDID